MAHRSRGWSKKRGSSFARTGTRRTKSRPYAMTREDVIEGIRKIVVGSSVTLRLRQNASRDSLRVLYELDNSSAIQMDDRQRSFMGNIVVHDGHWDKNGMHTFAFTVMQLSIAQTIQNRLAFDIDHLAVHDPVV